MRNLFIVTTLSIFLLQTNNLNALVCHSSIRVPENTRNFFKVQHSHNQRLYASQLPEIETEPNPRNINLIFEKLDELYTQSSIKIKCPFFRRRAADLIDSVAMITRFLLIRHKSLISLVDPTSLPFDATTAMEEADFLGSMTPPGCRACKQGALQSRNKCVGLSDDKIAFIIYKDWTRQKTNVRDEISLSMHDKGYYITGKLNSTIYRDDCLFDGPDPDMPVRGLRKYLSAASKLFDHKKSYADLLDIRIIESTEEVDQDSFDLLAFLVTNKKKDQPKARRIEATWRIGGVIMLPWHPEVKPYTGKTIYHIDEAGLIYLHEEKWDVGVLEVFFKVLFPDVAKKIWRTSTSDKLKI